MKTLLLILSLLLISTNAYAEWTFYSKPVDGTVLFYDKSSVKRNGNNVRVWKYVNFSPNNEKAKSINMSSLRELYEIDCVNETYIPLSMQSYTKPDLEGEETDVPDNYLLKTNYIVPNTTNATLMKLVCKK